MADLTRRGFLKQASVGAATVGALTTLPGLATAHASPAAHSKDLADAAEHGPLVAHVRNYATGEVAVMVGTREVIVHDRELVLRLVKAAR